MAFIKMLSQFINSEKNGPDYFQRWKLLKSDQLQKCIQIEPRLVITEE